MSHSFSQRIFFYFILLLGCIVIPLSFSLIVAQLAGTREAAALGMVIGMMIVHCVFAHKFLSKKFVFNLIAGITIGIVVVMLGIALSQSEPFNAFSRQFFTKDVFLNRILRSILVDAILAIIVWELVYWIMIAIKQKRTTAANASWHL